MDIELIEPIGEPSTWKDQLDQYGDSLHHIAFQIKGMQEKVAYLGSNSLPLVQRGEYTGGRYAYVDGGAQLDVFWNSWRMTDLEKDSGMAATASQLPLRRYGRTDLLVTPLCVGCAPLGSMPGVLGYSVTEAQALATLRAAFNGPISYLDTAGAYGESEHRIGIVLGELGGLPTGYVLATKVGHDPLPCTIVRPSLTYGDTQVPLVINRWQLPYTAVARMRQGKPVIVPGDGTSLWTITHNSDFAKGLVGLLGHQQAIGHA